ncbi:MAG: hypothetical protein K2M76_02680, partial [Muribaculaceae bacterium]|nr:hypothetical protein [Muribaculaceae bacterium]
ADEIGMDEYTEDVIDDNDDPDVPFDFDDRFDQDVDDTEQDEDENESEDQIPDRENVAGLPELRRLFTLNDKYRFRRELFGNDNAAMTDTVNMLEAMTSLAEAEDYLYNDMGWDAESDEVKE